MEIYCGNNSRSKEIKDGTSRPGTRYECLRKGIGRGLHMKGNFDDEYDKIDKRKIYCGNEQKLPDGYDYLGNAPLCLQIGIGIGKLQRNKIYTGPYGGKYRMKNGRKVYIK